MPGLYFGHDPLHGLGVVDCGPGVTDENVRDGEPVVAVEEELVCVEEYVGVTDGSVGEYEEDSVDTDGEVVSMENEEELGIEVLAPGVVNEDDPDVVDVE